MFLQTSYRQYLEFSLKLGYSERLVQQALKRLVNPTNNELLAELIKLGSTPGYENGNMKMHLEHSLFSFFFISSLLQHFFII
jgi:UBA-like domain